MYKKQITQENILNKDISLTLEGTQIDPDNNKNTDVTKETGKYYFKNNTHFVMTEDEALAHSARYKFNHRYLEVIKNGDINSKMYFEAGKEYSSIYRTPYGRMPLTFKTSSLTIIEKADTIEVSASYSLFSEDNLISNNQIKITINSK